MKKSKCCNAQATVSRYQYICHKCKEECSLADEKITKEEIFKKITPKEDSMREFGELLAEILAKHENDINNIKQQMK